MKRCDDRPKVAPIHPHVAVGDHEDVVTSRREHVFEIGYLQIAASDRGSNDERDIGGRHIPNQLIGDGQRAVLRIVRAQHKLQAGVILLDEGAQVLVEPRLFAVQRL